MNERHCGVLGWAVAIAAGVIIGGLVLSSLFWVFGLLFHILFFALRFALIIGLIAAVVWVLDRRRERRSVL